MPNYSDVTDLGLIRLYQADKANNILRPELASELRSRGLFEEADGPPRNWSGIIPDWKCMICRGNANTFYSTFHFVHGCIYCAKCLRTMIDDSVRKVQITTTSGLDGWKVVRYIGVESVEIVAGVGRFNEVEDEIGFLFEEGPQTDFERSWRRARRIAFNALKWRTYELGGNAVIGVSLECNQFSDGHIALLANGTMVEATQSEQALTGSDATQSV